MLCDICHEREAVLVYTLVINNQKTELHLCESCAIKKGLINSVSSLDLKDFIPLISHRPDIDKLKCPRCGLTYQEFMSLTKFGCSDCYKAFESELVSLVRRIHGSDEHIGKSVVKRLQNGDKLFELKHRLKKAIESESYEEAARIRDELKKYQKSSRQSGEQKSYED